MVYNTTAELRLSQLESWNYHTFKKCTCFSHMSVGKYTVQSDALSDKHFSHTPKVAAVQLIAHNQTELETMVKTTFMQLDAAI